MSADGNPEDFRRVLPLVQRYCNKKGISRISTVLDLREIQPEMAQMAVRRGAVPILLVVEVGVNRIARE
ncbi:MAG: hypothetical protein C4534_01540 [Gaiellales bacterium]|nr:MAG: hypothetical protein C4534_01540 [Gaiellales bacterium]